LGAKFYGIDEWCGTVCMARWIVFRKTMLFLRKTILPPNYLHPDLEHTPLDAVPTSRLVLLASAAV
jgi:hypothetical protein